MSHCEGMQPVPGLSKGSAAPDLQTCFRKLYNVYPGEDYMDTISGYIDHITFRNEENGYTVAQIITDDGELTCVGQMPSFSAGETIEAEGEYMEHQTYGRQFKVLSMRSVAPKDEISLLRYLGSGAVKGVGEKLAERIVKKFGEDTMRIIEEEPERLAEA